MQKKKLIKFRIATYWYSILLVSAEQFVNIFEFNICVQFGIIQFAPDSALNLCIRQFRPVEALQWVTRLWHIFFD